MSEARRRAAIGIFATSADLDAVTLQLHNINTCNLFLVNVKQAGTDEIYRWEALESSNFKFSCWLRAKIENTAQI